MMINLKALVGAGGHKSNPEVVDRKKITKIKAGKKRKESTFFKINKIEKPLTKLTKRKRNKIKV